MSAVVPHYAARPSTRPAQQFRHTIHTNIWLAPLVPVALAWTTGIVLDRHWHLPLTFSLVALLAGVVACIIVRPTEGNRLALAYLAVAVTAIGSAYHHVHRDFYAADDIGNYATALPRPVRIRGIVIEEPIIVWQSGESPWQSITRTDATRMIVRVTAMMQRGEWMGASGKVRLMSEGVLAEIHAGDSIEAVGRIAAPRGPANPGEPDEADALLDQGIRAEVEVKKTPMAVTRLREGWRWSLVGILGVIRGRGQRIIQESIAGDEAGVAGALVLGEGSILHSEDWERYICTGVVHVLIIAGQHLMVLAALGWLVFRLVGMGRRSAALWIAVFVSLYAMLTGCHAPVLRAAVMVDVYCIGLYLRRVSMAANSLAAAWIVITLLNPADVFNAGCQLSFLAVIVLYWGLASQERQTLDPLQVLIERSRPAWQRQVRRRGLRIAKGYATMLAVWLAAAPLVAYRYHLISPIALLIAPPAMAVASVALLGGFLLLLLHWAPPVAAVLGSVTSWGVSGCETLVGWAQGIPGGHWYVSDVPGWWLCGFYTGLMVWIFSWRVRQRPRWVLMVALCWSVVGWAGVWHRWPPRDLRCSFLAVGHGGCTVVETSDGRVLLYDAGAIGGPNVTRQHIAPFLWHRRIRHIDEVLISHADLDHFNGVPGLVERFSIGQVTCTPTFADKHTEGVPAMLACLHAHGIPVRIVRAGDRISADHMTLDVLHPPANGPEGNENARSMVLLLRHRGHAILLTGDLEGAGLERVLGMDAPHVDVLMAPHHGSRTANTPALARWASPRVVIACQGLPRGPAEPLDPYTAQGSAYLGTWPHGAITAYSRTGELVVETFQTKKRVVIDPARNPTENR